MSYKQREELKSGFYSVMLKEYKCEYNCYGHMRCDYSDGTVMFRTPSESLSEDNNRHMMNGEGRMLVFRPELITGTSLGANMSEYSFFSYYRKESLHISQREKNILVCCLNQISEELHQYDSYSRILVTKSIELLLDYCMRFYERQFIVRCEENKLLLQKTEYIIKQCFSDQTFSKELSMGKYCAEKLGISTAYFTDLLKYETGMTVEEYVECERFETAKKWLSKRECSVTQIAIGLGFPSSNYFNRFFLKSNGTHTRGIQVVKLIITTCSISFAFVHRLFRPIKTMYCKQEVILLI